MDCVGLVTPLPPPSSGDGASSRVWPLDVATGVPPREHTVCNKNTSRAPVNCAAPPPLLDRTAMSSQVPVVPMDRGNNTTCTINLHGATIVSWRVNNQVRGLLDTLRDNVLLQQQWVIMAS